VVIGGSIEDVTCLLEFVVVLALVVMVWVVLLGPVVSEYMHLMVLVVQDCTHLMALIEWVHFVAVATSVLHCWKTLAAASHFLAHKNSFLNLSYMG